MPGLSRRQFLSRLATLLGAGAVLSACGRQEEMLSGLSPVVTATPRPTYTPTATRAAPAATFSPTPATGFSPLVTPTYPPVPMTPTPAPLPADYTPVPVTPTPAPQPSPTSAAPVLSRELLTAHWPQTETSRVVTVRHSGVWAGDQLDPAVITQMLDAGLSQLAGGADALPVWRTLFDPQERVLLKVNCISAGGPTQPAVAYAVAQRLVDAGLAPENILIFDRTDRELQDAGYTLNDGGPGVQCHGARGEGQEATFTPATVRFWQELESYDAIINIPTPKGHGISGCSCALKNHFGSVNRPGALHPGGCDPSLAELNGHPIIQAKTRLVVGAAVTVSPFSWDHPEHDDVLLLAFDPVALDTVARDILVEHTQRQGQDGGGLVNGSHFLKTAQAQQVGATDVGLIDSQEVVLA